MGFLQWLSDFLGFNTPDFSKNFWPGFWSNLFSSFIVGVILTALIAKIIQWKNKAKLEINAVIDEKQNSKKLIISMRNIGRKPFLPNEINWNTYVPIHMRVESNTHPIKSNIAGVIYQQCGNHNPIALFPGNRFVIMELDVPQEPISIYYYFSTLYGYFPASAAPNKDGQVVKHKQLGKISVYPHENKPIIK